MTALSALKLKFLTRTATSSKLSQSQSWKESLILFQTSSRPSCSQILKELNKKVPDSLIRQRVEDGFRVRYVPWHLVNRIMNLHAPEWSGEVPNITYSPDNKSVCVVYRVTLYGTDAEVSSNSSLHHDNVNLRELGFQSTIFPNLHRRANNKLGLEDSC
ncbi:hypothetical protein K2173_001617 [Erythroxylum novogranatense]|uniref:Uncharacterized protein n=1 Tax=Erythroxylum novogranatense TaxID=1862640 RepID=A0AAV8T5A6_9ROSI|nr:hypothetical protein K2173_001617 [Erythroxylum novogranatense]